MPGAMGYKEMPKVAQLNLVSAQMCSELLAPELAKSQVSLLLGLGSARLVLLLFTVVWYCRLLVEHDIYERERWLSSWCFRKALFGNQRNWGALC